MADFLILLACGIAIYFWMMLVVTAHEAAHILVGRCVGFQPHRMTVGKGGLLLKTNVLGVELCWHMWPVCGRAYSLNIPIVGARWRGSLFALAGPFSDLLFFTGVVLLLNSLDLPQPTSALEPKSLLGILACMQAVWLVVNLWPQKIIKDGQVILTDGALFLSYVSGRRTRDLFTYQENVRRYDPSFQAGDAWFRRADLAHRTLFIEGCRDLEALRFDAACEKLEIVLEKAKMSRGERACLLDMLAGIPIFHGNPAFLERAIAWVEEARALCPEAHTLDGTLGSLLIEQEHYVEAIELLLPLTAQTSTPLDRSISACFLAKGAYRLGELAKAAAWLKMAQEADGCPPLYQRMAAEMKLPSASPERA